MLNQGNLLAIVSGFDFVKATAIGGSAVRSWTGGGDGAGGVGACLSGCGAGDGRRGVDARGGGQADVGP